MNTKKIFAALLFAVAGINLYAQSGTNSPYSQYGLGYLSEQTSGFNRGMNGLALGFREHNQVNYLNPASYSAIDSLSFIFDAGMSLQMTNFTEGSKKINANNGDLDYLVAGFRAAKHVGVSFGIIPLTNVGYNYEVTSRVPDGGAQTYTNAYSGTGGLRQVYLGAGWEPIRNFSLGANISYLWGDYERSLINSYSETTTNTIGKYYSADVSSYKIDLGAQYTYHLTAKDALTAGLTFSLGHKLGADAQCRVITTNPQTAVSDTITHTISNALELPTSFGLGLTWVRQNRLKVGLDYSLQRWGSLKFPLYTTENNVGTYTLRDNQFSDRHKITLGGEFCPQETGRKFFQRIHYRAGVSYATPYLKINGMDGPSEMSASLGLGVPIVNGYNNRSILNISVQYARFAADNLIKENTFRINIGLTFNERWFAKWKVE